RFASSVWQVDWAHLGEVIWQPRGVDSSPAGKIVVVPCFWGPARRMLSLAKMWRGPPAVLLRTRTSLMNCPEPPSAGWKWQAAPAATWRPRSENAGTHTPAQRR